MNHPFFKFFVLVCAIFALSGCVFSWYPSISDSTISVNDDTSLEVSRETDKKN